MGDSPCSQFQGDEQEGDNQQEENWDNNQVIFPTNRRVSSLQPSIQRNKHRLFLFLKREASIS